MSFLFFKHMCTKQIIDINGLTVGVAGNVAGRHHVHAVVERLLFCSLAVVAGSGERAHSGVVGWRTYARHDTTRSMHCMNECTHSSPWDDTKDSGIGMNESTR